MQINALSTLVLVLPALFAGAIPTPQANTNTCAMCPPKDLAESPLVAASGGTLGVPRFCGFSAAPEAGPQVICFYRNDGVIYPGFNSLCPYETEIKTDCAGVP